MTDVRGATTLMTGADVQATADRPADPRDPRQTVHGPAGKREWAVRMGMAATAIREDLATARIPQVAAAGPQTTVARQETTHGAKVTTLLVPGMSLGATMSTEERRRSLRR